MVTIQAGRLVPVPFGLMMDPKTGRIRDAVMEAQDILKRDPNNLEAHKLLGRIYLRSMGDIQGGAQNQNGS